MGKRSEPTPSSASVVPPTKRARGRPRKVVPPLIQAARVASATLSATSAASSESKAKVEKEIFHYTEKEHLKTRIEELSSENERLRKGMDEVHRANALHKEDVTSLQREKFALQRVLARLAADARRPGITVPPAPVVAPVPPTPQGDNMHQILGALLSQSQAYAQPLPAAAPIPRPPPQLLTTADCESIFSPSRDIHFLLEDIFNAGPQSTPPIAIELPTTLSPDHRHQILVMAGLGHPFVGVHDGRPVFQPGPFLRCPNHPEGTAIFAMRQQGVRFFYDGCTSCATTNTMCPLHSHEFHYIRLEYRGKTTIAWIPDYWLPRVLSYARIP